MPLNQVAKEKRSRPQKKNDRDLVLELVRAGKTDQEIAGELDRWMVPELVLMHYKEAYFKY